LETLTAAYDQRHAVIAAAIKRDVEDLLASLDLREPAELMATLVAIGALDIRIAVRSSGQGIYHEKLGIFRDALGNMVSFRGSSNETWSAWHKDGNVESFEVFTSWQGVGDADRVAKHSAYFEKLWQGTVSGVEVMPFPEAARQKLCSISKDGLDDLKGGEDNASRVARSPEPHQIRALASWRAAGCRGILEHATGSGKTYTALLAIAEHVRDGNLALILVPSVLLQAQWRSELRLELPDVPVLEVGGGHSRWRNENRLRYFVASNEGRQPRIVLATMQTAATEEFANALGKPQGLLLVADEVHQTGSRVHLRVLEIDAPKRLGLSATPRRAGDPTGTAAILAYFGGILQPPFTIGDAIAAGRLVNYEYHPHFVDLSSTELDEWARITEQLNREIARASGSTATAPTITERAKLLMIARSRIVKKANAKIALATNVVKAHYKPGQRWLVYCEDLEQLGAVRRGCTAAGIETHEYHSSMTGDKAGTLEWLSEYGGVVVSVRCLDEGVDIPQVTHALILASSQNPRQFIQRRGRALRKSPGKPLAYVHDALVLPPDPPSGPTFVSVAKAELARALEFARTALNPMASVLLREKAMEIGLELEGIFGAEFEEDADAGPD